VAPPPGRCAAAADLPTTGGLTKLKLLYLSYTQIADAGCAVLTAAFDSGALPALEAIALHDIPASAPRRRPPWLRHWLHNPLALERSRSSLASPPPDHTHTHSQGVIQHTTH